MSGGGDLTTVAGGWGKIQKRAVGFPNRADVVGSASEHNCFQAQLIKTTWLAWGVQPTARSVRAIGLHFRINSAGVIGLRNRSLFESGCTKGLESGIVIPALSAVDWRSHLSNFH